MTCDHAVGFDRDREFPVMLELGDVMPIDKSPFMPSVRHDEIPEKFVFCPRCGERIDWAVIERAYAASKVKWAEHYAAQQARKFSGARYRGAEFETW